MRPFGTSIIIAALGLGLLDCSDRKTDVDEEAFMFAEERCAKYVECGIPFPHDPEDSEEGCVDDLAGRDWMWRQGCRTETKVILTCEHALSCDDFAGTIDIYSDATKFCSEERTDWSICLAENANVDGG